MAEEPGSLVIRRPGLLRNADKKAATSLAPLSMKTPERPLKFVRLPAAAEPARPPSGLDWSQQPFSSILRGTSESESCSFTGSLTA